MIFLIASFVINLTMKVVITAPEKMVFVEEHAAGYYYTNTTRGIVVFYAFYSVFGSLVFITTSYRTIKMGVLSMFLGFFLDFALMKPGWVLDFAYLQVIPGSVLAFAVSILSWFVSWAAPTYITHKCFGGIP